MSYSPYITFIGGGFMCEAILSELLKTGHPSSHIRVSGPSDQRRDYLRSKYGVDVFADNNAAITGESETQVSKGVNADVVVLSVTPWVVGDVVRELSAVLTEVRPLVISVVAGVVIHDLARWIGGGSVPLVRLMPNMPSLIGEGAAGMYADSSVSAEQKKQTEYVVCSFAKEYFWVDKEENIDAVTAISGSGPGYFFLIIEAMEKAGIELGLPADTAKRLAAQTALGAARMILTGEDDVATLRRKVTSPNGTTHAAIEKMIESKVPEGIEAGVKACNDRCSALSNEFGKL
ncbi:hypothetical protein H4R24_004235 [Coemansia sp. RSA 988]|nr:hypothetical protein H4R24_004235 [Coemansia sp. RSA 988]